MSLNLAPYQGVFGLPPPTSSISDDMIRNSMPVLEITPGEPNFSFGLALFRINTSLGWKNFNRLLNNHGFSLGGTGDTTPLKPVKFAFIADNFPTDTFTNEYGENFLQGIGDVASSTAAQVNQIFGKKNAFETLGSLANAATGLLPTDLFGMGINLQEGAQKFLNASGALAKTVIGKIGVGGAVDMVGRLAAGARLDFPMIWKSAGFQPSYSITIRLYNPNPRSVEATKKYIVGPIVALMLLGVPISQDGITYSWPFLHKIVSPGIFELNPGFISNITVIKGGDQQQISQQQRLAMADVRIDVGSLFSSMVAGTNIDQRTRPTVRKYMNVMLGEGDSVPKRHQIFDRKGQRLGEEGYKLVQFLDNQSKISKNNNVWSPRRDRYPLPTQKVPPTESQTTETANTRVAPSRQNLSAYLAAANPYGYGFRATDEEQ